MVAGIALLDYDNDGKLDVFLTNGAKMTELDKTEPVFWNRLYHNLGDWKFEDVTEKAGLKGHGYDNGVATGDFDNDGFTDLFVAGLKANMLYRNKGDGAFEDVTGKAGLKKPDPDYGTLWSVAAAFFDYDKDGDLDLFVSNYVIWIRKPSRSADRTGSTTTAIPTTTKGCPTRSTGTRATAPSRTFRRPRGSARWSARAWAWASPTSTRTATPTCSWRTTRSPTISSATAATALSRRWASPRASPIRSRAGRCRAWAPTPATSTTTASRDVFHTALSNETMPVFQNQGKNSFVELTARSGVSALTLSRAGWGNGIVDFNNDGRKDLFVAGGDVMDPNGEFREKVRQTNLVLANLGRFKFGGRLAHGRSGLRHQARGTPRRRLRRPRRRRQGRRDRDGARRRRRGVEEREPGAEPLAGRANRGQRSNRDGMGAEITLTTPSGVQHSHVNTAVGYGCASDVRVHFGLGKDETVTKLEVRWPSGAVQVLEGIASNQVLVVKEPEK